MEKPTSPLLDLPPAIRTQIWLYALNKQLADDQWGPHPHTWSTHAHIINGKPQWVCVYHATNQITPTPQKHQHPYRIAESSSSPSNVLQILQICKCVKQEVLELLLDRTDFELVIGPRKFEFDERSKSLVARMQPLPSKLNLPPMRSVTLTIQAGNLPDVKSYEKYVRWVLKTLLKEERALRRVRLRFNLSCFLSDQDRYKILSLFINLPKELESHSSRRGSLNNDVIALTSESLNILSCPTVLLRDPKLRCWQRTPEDVDNTRALALEGKRGACYYNGAEQIKRPAKIRPRLASGLCMGLAGIAFIATLPLSLPFVLFLRAYSKAWD